MSVRVTPFAFDIQHNQELEELGKAHLEICVNHALLVIVGRAGLFRVDEPRSDPYASSAHSKDKVRGNETKLAERPHARAAANDLPPDTPPAATT